MLAQADLASLGREAGPDDHRLELVAGGATFAMQGLAPGAPAPLPPARHFFAMTDSRDSFPFEALALAPARPAKAEAEILSQVQAMVEAAALVARRTGARAVCWAPAASWMDAAYFVRMIENWRSGGPFPALGLTPLVRSEEGTLVSDGLALFTGRELQVEPRRGEHGTDTVKVAVHAIDQLLRASRRGEARSFRGPRGERLEVEPSSDGMVLALKRGP